MRSATPQPVLQVLAEFNSFSQLQSSLSSHIGLVYYRKTTKKMTKSTFLSKKHIHSQFVSSLKLSNWSDRRKLIRLILFLFLRTTQETKHEVGQSFGAVVGFQQL